MPCRLQAHGTAGETRLSGHYHHLSLPTENRRSCSHHGERWEVIMYVPWMDDATAKLHTA